MTPDEAVRKINAKFEEIKGKDHFVVLGVPRTADAAAVKKAYFALAREFHTDVYAGINLGPAQQKLDHVFQALATAYATLTDPKKRGDYEAKLKFEADGASSDIEKIFEAENDMERARNLVERGELAGALKLIEKLLPVNPKSDEVLGYQKYCKWYLTRSAAAAPQVIRELETHWKAAPGALALKAFQGWVALESKDLRTAQAAFKKVLEMDPKHASANRGMRLVQTRKK